MKSYPMIMVLALMKIIKTSLVSVAPPTAVAILSEKGLGGELSLKEKNVILYK